MAEEQSEKKVEKLKTRLDLAIASIPLLQNVLSLTVVVGVVFSFYQPLSFALLNKDAKIAAFGISLEFARKGPLHEIFKLKTPNENFEAVFGPLNARLQRSAESFVGAKILWIDDHHPLQNMRERDVIREMGLFVEFAKTAEEAESLIQKVSEYNLRPYDLIISDNTWGENKTGGQEFFGRLTAKGLTPRCILYTGSVDPMGVRPNYVFGMTDRYDELCHLIMDALERNIGRLESNGAESSVSATSAGVR